MLTILLKNRRFLRASNLSKLPCHYIEQREPKAWNERILYSATVFKKYCWLTEKMYNRLLENY